MGISSVVLFFGKMNSSAAGWQHAFASTFLDIYIQSITNATSDRFLTDFRSGQLLSIWELNPRNSLAYLTRYRGCSHRDINFRRVPRLLLGKHTHTKL